MAVQRADPEYDRPRRRWWERGVSAVSHVAGHDVNGVVNLGVNQVAGQSAGQAIGHDVSHAAGHAVSLPMSSGASHARSSASKPASRPVRIGDAIVHPDIDGLPVPEPTEYAREFVGFLLAHPALQDQLGGWISSGALKRRYYPEFGATIGKWPLLPWRTVAVERGYFLKKRDRQTRRLMRRGKLRRLTVSEYRIPEAQGGDH